MHCRTFSCISGPSVLDAKSTFPILLIKKISRLRQMPQGESPCSGPLHMKGPSPFFSFAPGFSISTLVQLHQLSGAFLARPG